MPRRNQRKAVQRAWITRKRMAAARAARLSDDPVDPVPVSGPGVPSIVDPLERGQLSEDPLVHLLDRVESGEDPQDTPGEAV
jgi:hypothetical protein